ncbi:MAG TPA: serine--tRNA ligase [Paenibacillaceae bacterium]
MLDVRLLRTDLDRVKRALRLRGMDEELVAPFTELDTAKREKQTESEALKNRRNVVSQEVARRKRSGEDAEPLIAEMREVNERIRQLDEEVRELEAKIEELLLTLPNIPHETVPFGQSDQDNVEIRRVGILPEFPFEPKPHWEIAERLGILDFAAAAKTSGARFVFYRGLGARLERALINFMMDLHAGEHGYEEMLPPYLVNRDSLIGTGQLPKFEEDLFKVEGTGHYLIPTAEVPVTNFHREEILSREDLPRKYVAYSACFRAEAGAAGRDTRGLIRQHQFDKVELVQFVEPEKSDETLEELTGHAENVLKKLGLPYRVIVLCTGDMGFAAAKTYDIEVWMPGAGVYREISSCSNFGDFQARRAGIRFRREKGAKPEFVHTLNGSGLAVGRTVAAILENFQEADGSVRIPEALRPYMGGIERISPRS